MKGYYLVAWIISLTIWLLAVYPSETGASSVQFPRRGPGDFRDRDKRSLHIGSRIRRKRADSTEMPQHYIKVALVFDETFLPPLGLRDETLERLAFNITEAVDQTFRQLKIRALLVAMETWISKEYMNVSSPQLVLEEFRRYSRSLPINHDVAFLLMFNSSDTEKSMTSFDSICRSNQPTAGVIQVSDNTNPLRVSTLISRGIATSIGLLPDTDSCHCGSQMCLMNASTISATPGFSDCSDQTFQYIYKRGKLWCLDSPPRNIKLIESPLCGNGIVESGEECDCNNNTECLTCCRECALVQGAECAGGRCCNSQCKLLMAGSICRERRGSCDIPEYCTGNSENCPENLVLHNGAPCKKKGMCHAGVCETMQDQCSQLWGQGSLLSRTSCSPNITAKIIRTAPQYSHSKCGLLTCDVTDVDMTSLQARSVMQMTDWSSTTESQCKVVSIPLSDGTNRGAVSDGTACGRGKICNQGSCVPVDRPSCPVGISNKICSRNGICSISGQCVCFCGWQGPSCAVRNSTREGSICIPKSRFSTNDVTTNTKALPTESNDKLNEGEVRVLTSAIIGGSLAIIFVVAIIFGATSIGFKKARKNNQARRMQQVKLFSMFQPTKSQKKRLAKFGGGRSPYIAGEIEGASSSMITTSASDDRHHHQHHIPKHHKHHHGGGGQPGGRMHGKNKKQKKVRLLIDMDTHKPDKAGGRAQARTETII